ncbi:MAG: ATP-binding protein [bacterium]|nr:ATP-binding protein [bacterium]
MELAQIEDIVNDQTAIFLKKDQGFERDINLKKYIESKQIVVISGVRRSGKSTLLKQFSLKVPPFYYINFDDERLINFTVQDFNTLIIIWKKKFQSKYIFIDEIQNINNWERFIRRIHDEGYRLFITGSNAKLLSSELSTHLTGRHKKIELFPFSFKELVDYRKVNISGLPTSETKAKILKLFDNYLIHGGFPEYIKYKDNEYLKRIYEDIIYRDIITRFGIKEVKSFRELTNYIFTNFTKEASYNTLKNILGIKTTMSVRAYVGFLEESYLIFELFKYDFSLRKQYVSDKKLYVIDNGMRNATAFYFSADRGRLLENLVYIELKRRGLNLYFFKDKSECDFLIQEKNNIVQAIQVTQKIDKTNEKREFDGLINTLDRLKIKNGIILTENQNEIRTVDSHKIIIKPIWQWLLNK